MEFVLSSPAEIDAWMGRAVEALHAQFGDRLLVVGLQGSARRGEAGPDSDLDVLIVVDDLTGADLRACRAVLDTLPHGERAHGFTCGRRELAVWPADEIFAFSRDVRCYHGDLLAHIPTPTRADIVAGARKDLSALYHLTGHTIMAKAPEHHAAAVVGRTKQAYFCLLQVEYLRSGHLSGSKAELADRLDADERALLTPVDERDPDAVAARLDALLAWSGTQLAMLRRPTLMP